MHPLPSPSFFCLLCCAVLPVFWQHTSLLLMMSMDGSQFPFFPIQFLQFLVPVNNSKVHLCTGTVNDPVASILFFALKSVPKTSLILLKYSFFYLSFCNLMLYVMALFYPQILNTFLRPNSLISFSSVLLTYVFLWTLPSFKQIFSYFSNPKFILTSLLIAFIICISFSKSFLTGTEQFQVICIW